MDKGTVLELDRPTLVDPANPFDEKGTVKVLLAQPSYGLIDATVHDNRMDFVMALARIEAKTNVRFFTGNVGRTPINFAREMIVHEAVKQGMDYVLMIDDDMIVPKSLFERLYKVALEKDADIVTPLCTQRLHPFYPVFYKHTYQKVERDGKQAFELQNTYVTNYKVNEVIELDGCGFGVVLMNTRLIKKMTKPMFFSNTNIGEDIWFCIKAKKEANARIFADTSIKIGHMRTPEIATEYDFLKATKQFDRIKEQYGDIEKSDIETVNAKTERK